jgi:hypothetical protein
VEPTLDVSISSGEPGMLRIWGMSMAGLQAEYAYTPEFGFAPSIFEDRYDLYGENFALAMLQVFGAAEPCDLNVDLACNLADVDLLTSVGDLVAGVTGIDPKFDLTWDGIVDGADLALWLSEAASHNGLGSSYLLGDANLDGSVDGSDFNAWNAAKFTSGTVWHQGDFNGDGFADGSDFNLWNSHKFMSSDSGSQVPEPLTDLAAMICALVVLRTAYARWQMSAPGCLTAEGAGAAIPPNRSSP